MNSRNGVHLPGLTKVVHLVGQDLGELGVHGVGDGGGHLQAVSLDELLLDVRQEEEGPGTLELLRRNGEICEYRLSNE